MRRAAVWFCIPLAAALGPACSEPPEVVAVGPGALAVGAVGPEWPADAPLPPDFDTPPWVTMPAPGRIAIGFYTAAETAASVELTQVGDPAPFQPPVPSVDAGTLHHVDLGVLPAATSFSYRVVLADGASREGVFTTPGAPRWRFVQLGEFHAPSESDHVARFADAIRAFRPQVVVEAGDMVDSGDDLDDWRDYLRTSSPWISNAILLPAHSNHVNGFGGNQLVLAQFDLPDSERWYTTRWGDVEVVTLDSTYDGPSSVFDTELAWLAQRMASVEADADPPGFVVAAWHYPACSSHYSSRRASRRWVIDNLVASFEAAGALDLVLVAHDKYYERSSLDTALGPIPHVMVNAGRLAPSDEGDNEPECTPIRTDTGARSLLLVNVSTDELDARVIDEHGAGLDAFAVPRRR